MGCFPCNNLQPEVAHLNACYPPPKALATAGPDYRPMSQDLSKLTYFATNKPSKLAKIGEELEKRVTKEATRSTGGYPKSRASLLISLAILRALLTECKRDLPLFGRSALRVIRTSLDVRVYQRGGPDLEVIGRAAAAFIAFTTFTDGASIGIDEGMTKTYLDLVRRFGVMASSVEEGEKVDMEQQNRTRLIALAALNGAATSDAMFASNTEFPRQVAYILPALLQNLFEGTMEDMKLETAKIDMDASPSPFFSEFSARRPINDRRAPSLHAHTPGEKGPLRKDVLSAALRSFHALIGQCKIAQATIIIDQIGAFLDQRKYWSDVERCCWLAEKLTAWITLQYRFVVPTRLVEVLVDEPDHEPSTKHTSALAMITTILNSTTSLVGLGVTDLLGNFVALIIRRIRHDDRDPLLPALVQCVSSLGTHIYYADQINDIVEEISLRMAELPTADKHRSEILRVLVHAIMGVMVVADQADEEARSKMAASTSHGEVTPSRASVDVVRDKGKGPAFAVDTPPLEIPSRPKSSRRNPIAPEVWQETLPLLCEADYSVRAAYARALLLFLETELPRGSTPGRPGSRTSPTADASTYRFCNAVYAAVYTLVMSSSLGIGPPAPDETSTRGSVAADSPVLAPSSGTELQAAGNTGASRETRTSALSTGNGSRSGSRHGSVSGKGEKGVSFNLISATPSATPPHNGSATPPRKAQRTARRPSLPLNRLNSYVQLNSFDNVATPLDFSAALKILDDLHTLVPVPALLTGVPMLLALDRDAGNDLIRRPNDGRQGAWVLERKRAIRELVALVWRRIGDRWSVADVEHYANEALTSLREPYLITLLPPYTPSTELPMPEQPTSFIQHTLEGEGSSASKPLLESERLVVAMAGSGGVQDALGRNRENLTKRWGIRWTVEGAIKDSVERYSSVNVKPGDGDLNNDIASVLMNMNNGSIQSFGARPVSRSIDVDDLREALGGKVSMPDPHSGPPSVISSLTPEDQHHLSIALQRNAAASGGGRSRKEADVKEVLKDIFNNKKRAGHHGSKAVHGYENGTVTAAGTSGRGTPGSAASGTPPTSEVPNGRDTGLAPALA
ncbi:hypothetical protein IAU60_004454 [Kwoniella sp. DSM 27419]